MSKMESLPQEVVADLKAFRDVVKQKFADRVVALVLYGSAARGIYQPHASDVNLLIALKGADVPLLKALGEAMARSFKSARPAPYVITKAELRVAANAFPTRFVEMKRGYEVLLGSDVLADIRVSNEDLALRTRQELLNLLLRFRRQIVIDASPDGLQAAMRGFLPAFVKILRTLVCLKTGEHVGDRNRLIEIGARLYDFPAAPFGQLLAWRRQEVDLRGADWEEAAKAFLDGVQKVAEGAAPAGRE